MGKTYRDKRKFDRHHFRKERHQNKRVQQNFISMTADQADRLRTGMHDSLAKVLQTHLDNLTWLTAFDTIIYEPEIISENFKIDIIKIMYARTKKENALREPEV